MRNLMFVFADLVNLTDKEIQILLRIVQLCRQLEEQGQIVIMRGDSNEEFG